MSGDGWLLLDRERPESKQKVEWLCPNTGDVVKGSMAGRLWVPDGSGVYVYYEPVFWRPREG